MLTSKISATESNFKLQITQYESNYATTELSIKSYHGDEKIPVVLELATNTCKDEQAKANKAFEEMTAKMGEWQPSSMSEEEVSSKTEYFDKGCSI